MTNGEIVPVVVGLAIGIAFVGLFSAFSTSLPITSNHSPSSVNAEIVPDWQVIEVEVVDSGLESPSIAGQEEVVAEEAVHVDFSAMLAEQDIVVKKGQTVKIPILIESERETEKVLSLSIIARSDVPDSTEIELSLDKGSVVLSKNDIKDQEQSGSGRVIRDAGFLIISTSTTAKAGTYEFGLEASYEDNASGEGMGTGQVFRVTIVE